MFAIRDERDYIVQDDLNKASVGVIGKRLTAQRAQASGGQEACVSSPLERAELTDAQTSPRWTSTRSRSCIAVYIRCLCLSIARRVADL